MHCLDVVHCDVYRFAETQTVVEHCKRRVVSIQKGFGYSGKYHHVNKVGE